MLPDMKRIPFARNTSTPKASLETITATFWTVYVIEAALPLLVISIGAMCRNSLQNIMNFDKRTLNYDTQLLRRPEARTPLLRVKNIAFWRHRPLPLEILRVCIEVALLLHILGYASVVIVLSLWCIFDLVQGLHVLNLIYLRHTPPARNATSLATYITTMYSLLYGFPLGFISKLMWVVWLGEQLPFATIFIPLYIEAVAALVFALFFMLPNMCWRASVNGCKAVLTRFQVLLLLLCFFAMWLLIYFNVAVCDAQPMNDSYTRIWFNRPFHCAVYFRSWTTSLLPVMILLIVSQFVLLWSTVYTGMVYRFLPEMAFVWSGSLAFSASIYSEDVGRGAVIGGTGAVLLISIFITIGVNGVLLSDILQGLKAPVILHSQSSGRASEVEVKRRIAMRQSALKDYINEGGKTMLKGTLLRHLKKRDRTKECVVCLELFKKTRELQGEDAQMNEEEGTATEDLLGIIRKCGHYFHFNCVWDWIQRNNTCPLCRTSVLINKDTIKTLHYDDVRYALERSMDQFSTVSSISELVSKAADSSAKSKPVVTGTVFNRSGVAVPDGSERSETAQPQGDIDATTSGASNASGDSRRKVIAKLPTKYCTICKEKFRTERQEVDIVVGYLRNCGHYFHYECIYTYVRKREKCPACQSVAWQARKEGNGPDLTAGSNQSESGRPSSEDRGSRHGHDLREPPEHAPPRGSRRHRQEASRKHRSRAHLPPVNADLISPNPVRSSSSSNVPDIVQMNPAAPGPSRPRNGYVRNPKSSNVPVVRRFVHSEDILFVFLSDVQADIKRSRGRKTPTQV